jgi:integrase
LNKHITPHILRHTHTSLLAEEGIPLDTISRRLGHTDSALTLQIYTHITEKRKAKDNAMLSAVKIL